MYYCYLSVHWAIMLDWDKFDFTRLEAREQSPPFPGASRQVRTDQRCRWYHKVSQWWMMIRVIIALPLRLHHETTFVRTCYKKQPLRLRPNCLYIIPRTMLDAVIISAALCHPSHLDSRSTGNGNTWPQRASVSCADWSETAELCVIIRLMTVRDKLPATLSPTSWLSASNRFHLLSDFTRKKIHFK